jgi:two-component system, chemotaxis family, protein-glutamate methylesterase/glutaminase
VIKLLIVDDSALMRRVLGSVFKDLAEFEVAFARDGVEALARLHEFQPHVITLDVQMPLMEGLACLDRIMLERPCPVIMVSSLTADGAEETLEAIELGAVDFIPKPAGAISLAMEEFAPLLLEKVRAAARARLPSALRLAERVRLRLNAASSIVRNGRPIRAGTAPVFPSPGQVDGVVLIGTSTGGPPALDAVLSRLPAEFPWPILIAQHMPGMFTGPLARRLDKLCALAVFEVTRPTPLARGYVYVGKGDADIVITSKAGAQCADVAASSAEYRWHPSVDRLVATAMRHFEARRLVGVLMTGMGNDGAAAMTRLKAEGGRTIAEAEETAVVWGMPGELVKAGGAAVVLPVSKIADQLLFWNG